MVAMAIQWELCGANFRVNNANFLFRFVMRIMTARRMITWKTLATPGFWLHHTPCSLGCWTNSTFVARSFSPNLTTLQGYPWPLRLNYWIGFLKLGNLVLHLLPPTMFLSMQNCYTTDQCLVYSIKKRKYNTRNTKKLKLKHFIGLPYKDFANTYD